MFLPILWFVLNVLSFNTFSNNYEQKNLDNAQSAYWSASPSDNSSDNKSQTYFSTEKIEENVEEDSEHESDLETFGGSLDLAYNQFTFINQTAAFKKLTACLDDILTVAFNQAKFILFRNIRI
ncbi:MAG: hypothetical protein ACK4YV_05955 [Emticicia sp.]